VVLRPAPRAAISAIFLLNGAVSTAGCARVPSISDRLDLSPGEIGAALLGAALLGAALLGAALLGAALLGAALLGAALLGAPVGLLLAQPLVGALIARRGSPALLRFAPWSMLVVVAPVLALDLPTLALAAAVTGVVNGALDIVNARGHRRPRCAAPAVRLAARGVL
jgi:hypothetical protein